MVKEKRTGQSANLRADSIERMLSLIGRLTYSRWLVVAVLLIATVLIVWNTFQRTRELEAQERLLVQTSVDNAAREIVLQVSEFQRAVMLFAQSQRGLILRVARGDSESEHRPRQELASLDPHDLTDGETPPGTPPCVRSPPGRPPTQFPSSRNRCRPALQTRNLALHLSDTHLDLA